MTSFTEPVGLLKKAKVIEVDQINNQLTVRLLYNVLLNNQNHKIIIKMPYALQYPNGMFIGSLPQKDSIIIIGQGSGNEWYFVSNYSLSNSNIPLLQTNELKIQSNNNKFISLSDKIKIGNNQKFISLTNNYYNSLESKISINLYGMTVNSTISREYRDNSNFSDYNKKSEEYFNTLKKIALDVNKPISYEQGKLKNPTFIEKRSLTYEFDYDFNVKSDYEELKLISGEGQTSYEKRYSNRKKTIADTLSLSQFEPNYLIEKVEGTVVDIFGNILDINRSIIKFNKKDNDKDNFIEVKKQHRKGIAYHFELNAKKDFTNNLPDVNSTKDYAKTRSRFFVDIDKEGLFKINVPASSETGNVPLLSRYENSSWLDDSDTNPNNLIYTDQDIFLDSFHKGSISLKNNDGESAPKDRISGSLIKAGMAYHNILDVCKYSQTNDALPKQYISTINKDSIITLSKVATDTIFIDGPSANAGGRSGQMNLDGSLELNIGANTADRQSLWLNTSGGIVAALGRDKEDNSAIVQMDGNLWLQIGGEGISTDSRFPDGNGFKAGSLDIRVFTDGKYQNIIRIDNNGITIMTPSRIQIQSSQDISIRSDANLTIDAERLYLNNRQVSKSGPSI
jgi:hypothetical protein